MIWRYNMNVLAIDTSTECASIALSVDGELYCEEQGSLRQHAQLLLPMIERVLAISGTRLNQLNGIAFGCGPGSFTGLRIACAVAKGLSYAHDLPLFPVSSLATIASDVFHTETNLAPGTQVLAMIDARMQQVYWASFFADSFTSHEQVTAAADVVLTSASPLILAGVGLETYAPQLSASIQSQCVKQSIVFPHASAMVRLVQSGYVTAVSAAEALPVYVRNQVTHGS